MAATKLKPGRKPNPNKKVKTLVSLDPAVFRRMEKVAARLDMTVASLLAEHAEEIYGD